MEKMLSALIGLAAVLVLPHVAYGDDNGGNSVRIRIGLSGAQEVPGVITNTTGTLRLNNDPGLSEANFRLKVNDGIGVTQAHLHCARAGANGPAVVFLFGFVSGVDVDGVLSTGTLTNLDFTGADCTGTTGRPINNIASLALAARDGLIYVNVHTVANPAGEVRGQLLEDEDSDSDSDSDSDYD